MKRMIFSMMMMVAVLLGTVPAAAQQSYGYNYGYQPSYYYGSYGQHYGYPSYQQNAGYPGNYYQAPEPQRTQRGMLPPQVDVSDLGEWQKNPEYFEFIRARTKKDYGDNPVVEIWLEKRIGRLGDYWFEALGGKKSHPTPKGTFTVKSKYEDFYSRKYDAEMPLSVFFTEQCAIHVGSLRVLSHGCIHVERKPARKIFEYAKAGKSKVRVHP